MGNVLIFDYDGVIADSLEIFMKKVIAACKKYGSNQVNTKEDFLNLFDGNLYENLIEQGISKEIIPKMMGDFQMGPEEQSKINLFNGVMEMLQKLSKRNKIIIVTSNITGVVESSLKLKNIDYFEEVIGADKETSKVKKIEAVKSMYNGNNYFYIGDTKGDIIEGRKAGVKTIAVAWGWHSEKKLKEEKPDFIVHTPQELVDLFKNSNGL